MKTIKIPDGKTFLLLLEKDALDGVAEFEGDEAQMIGHIFGAMAEKELGWMFRTAVLIHFTSLYLDAESEPEAEEIDSLRCRLRDFFDARFSDGEKCHKLVLEYYRRFYINQERA